MKSLSKVIKSCFFVFIVLSFFLGGFSSGYNIVLKSQNPNPVSPGNIVFLTFSITNQNDFQTNNVNFEIVENSVFSVSKDEVKRKNLGSFLEGQTATLNHKVLISQNANSGQNTLKVNVGGTLYDIDILVQDSSPKIQINNFIFDNVEPGQNTKLNLEIENTNNVEIKDLFVEIDLENIEDKILNLNGITNKKFVRYLGANEKTNLEFDLLILPSATIKPYLIPIKLTYKDSFESEFENEIYGSLNIYSKPEFLITQNTFENGELNLEISNIGISRVKGLILELRDNEKYEVIEGNKKYIGDLNIDDVQSQSFMIVSQSKVEKDYIDIKLIFLDSYNKKVEETFRVEVNENNSENKSNNFSKIIVILVLALLFYFFSYRKRKPSFFYNFLKQKK